MRMDYSLEREKKNGKVIQKKSNATRLEKIIKTKINYYRYCINFCLKFKMRI